LKIFSLDFLLVILFLCDPSSTKLAKAKKCMHGLCTKQKKMCYQIMESNSFHFVETKNFLKSK
jgi:hypothetical protein